MRVRGLNEGPREEIRTIRRMMMIKKGALITLAILAAGAFAAVSAQDAPTVSTPAVADNAQPFNDNIKLRSVELDRIKREAEKTAVLRRENGKELKFSIIKEDFEGIQMEQMKIVEAYTMSENVDYKAISKSSDKITEMAVRLRANVFTPEEEPAKTTGDEKENPYLGKSVRDLIVTLDNAIGEVVTNPMWQKLAVIDRDNSVKAEASILKVIEASSALWIESKKKSGN